MKRLVIIDGHAILYRAFHALPITLTTPDGKPVNAVYGFIRMLLKVISDLKPTHLAVAFDRPKPTFRKKLFKDYQAKRPKAPDDLIAQIDLVHQVVEAMEIPIYEKDGFEADDVIGTLAKQALRSGTKFFVAVDRPSASSGLITSSKKFAPSPRLLDVIIVTGDKDILQLVDENTRVYMPIKGLSLSRLYGKKDVKEKFGIESEQMVDYKALIGDPSDNYPGVNGVGPKTAVELLKNFGTLEKIYGKITHVHNFVNERVFRALKQDKEQAELAKKLAKIVTNVPVKLDLKKAQLGNLDKSKVRKLFEKLEFKSLIQKLSGEKLNEKRTTSKKTENAEKNKQLSLI